MDRRRFLQWGTAAIVGTRRARRMHGRRQRQRPAAAAAHHRRSRRARAARDQPISRLAKTAASLEAMLVGRLPRRWRASTRHQLRIVDATPTCSCSTTTPTSPRSTASSPRPSGQAAVDAPNEVMENQIVRPALDAAKTQDDFAHLFFTLEDAIAQTYVYASTAMSRAGPAVDDDDHRRHRGPSSGAARRRKSSTCASTTSSRARSPGPTIRCRRTRSSPDRSLGMRRGRSLGNRLSWPSVADWRDRSSPACSSWVAPTPS